MTQRYSDANRLLLITAAALIDDEQRVLVQLRPEGRPMAGLWEFPGGKVEPGETPVSALVRELCEELDIGVAVDALEALTFASEPLGDRDLLLLLFVCRHWTGDPKPLVASDLRWCRMDELRTLEMPPADIPLVERLSRLL